MKSNYIIGNICSVFFTMRNLGLVYMKASSIVMKLASGMIEGNVNI
jgi:hypothetical protein